uniref:Uncharacterized protein n=1 Tax=Chromera velia CCMP2878 TaxID=1169474 RepID=A0A0G4GDI8_9ALVE|eukprot:Cvel_21397.t1-p1 / transcript=Cvel_21397.t1 / gene=Cvel_21397 / organism=Chromera_velia_CCMP2878 / gene_product=hypothetical protein / transcript_product=hypothetical protein / location=Cvel_scaffold2003:31096-35178(+) / protein_length=478 / sequence_SO=supercontig / SO=protein_coding / is_pseudo=false
MIPDGTLGIIFVCISVFQFFSGIYLFHVSAHFIGSQQMLRLRWEKGYNNDVVGARSLPLNRFVGSIVSLVSFVEYSIRACQMFDKAAGRDPGLDVTPYMYWGYLVGCPLIIWDFAETLGVEGIPFYSAATFFCILVGFWTEHIRSSAQWFLFGTGDFLVGIMAWNVGKRALYVLNTLIKHDVSKPAARWLVISLMTFGLGWCVFPIAWLLRDDIHSVGTVDTSYIALLHGFGDVVSKPLFAMFLTQYRTITEDLHLKSILRALNWLRDFENKKADFEFKDVPEEVVIVTVPALLESCMNATKPAEVKKALDVVRARSMTGKKESMAQDAALLMTQLQQQDPGNRGTLMVPDVEGQTHKAKTQQVHSAPEHLTTPQMPMTPMQGAHPAWPHAYAYPCAPPYPYPYPYPYAYPYPPCATAATPGSHHAPITPAESHHRSGRSSPNPAAAGRVDQGELEKVLNAVAGLEHSLDARLALHQS